jgi:predicted ArsR family transcriptional regulator
MHETDTSGKNKLNEAEEQFFGLTPADPAVRPNYYHKDGLECFDVIKRMMGTERYQGFLWGNVQKYLWRWEDKNGKQDLEKAIEYLVKLVETLP